MNIRELILPFLLAIMTWWGIRYFFFSGTPADNYRFTAPQSAVECKPLNKDISFIETKRSTSPTITPIETDWGKFEFSTDGATLTRLEFKRKMNGKTQILGTIFPPDAGDKANRAFIVGLKEDTPFVYKLVDHQEDEKTISLTYVANAQDGEIKKTFIVHKDKNQMDLKLDLDPHGDRPMQARLFYPAPIMPALKGTDVISADILDGSDNFTKVSQASIKGDDGWLKPEIFGVEDKYFVHSLVKDPESFAERAYFKTADKKLTAILEGPHVTDDGKEAISHW